MPTHRHQTPISPQQVITLKIASRSGRRSFGWNWTQLLVLTFLLWVSLVYSGIGSAIGVPPDVVANRIEARTLAQMRQSGTSQVSRSAGEVFDFEISALPPSVHPPKLLFVPFVASLAPPDFYFVPNEPRTEQPEIAGLHATVSQRWQMPLTRAPPSQALKN